MTRPDSGGAWRAALVVCAAAVYFGTPQVARPVSPQYEHFPRFASAFLHGRLSVEAGDAPTFREDELIPADAAGRWYLAYPPLPAILLMPFVALFGASVKTAVACRIVSVINVLLIDVLLSRMLAMSAIGFRADDVRAKLKARMILGAMLAFGTVTWHNSHAGGDWHLAHAVALGGALLALIEFFGRRRPLWIGAAIAAVMLTRPTAACVGIFCALPLLRAKDWRGVLKLSVWPVAACWVLVTYNAIRFGNPQDFGYSRMVLGGSGLTLMQQYGQFHPHFVPRNFFWFFLAPPWPRASGFPIGFDPRGLSLFVASPALLLAAATIIRRWKEPMVRDASAGIVFALVGLLMYFNTGFWQFGHRFSMDYLPLLAVLMVRAAADRSARRLSLWVTVSIAIAVIGNTLQPIARLPAWLSPWG